MMSEECVVGNCKTWTLDYGLDRGLDHGLQYGPYYMYAEDVYESDVCQVCKGSMYSKDYSVPTPLLDLVSS